MQTLCLRRFSLWFLMALVMAASAHAAQTYTWAGGASTAWLTATNWSPNGVPGVDDTAIINSGSPQLPGDAVALPQIQFNSGTLTGTGTVTSSMIWSAGRIDGILTIGSGASLTISGASSNHELANGGTINNSGTTTWSGGYIWRLATDSSATTCAVNNLAGGVFEMTGNNYAYVNGGRAWTFNNAGTLRKITGTGTSQMLPTAFNNSGAVEVQTGTLELGGTDSVSPGSFNVTAGAVLNWKSGAITSGATLTGPGEQRISGGSLNGVISATNLRLIGSVGGTCTLGGTAILNAGTLTGSLEMTGSLDWQSGSVHGTLAIASGGSLTISGINVNHELANGGTVNNSGTVIWSGGLLLRTAADASGTSCSFNNLAGGLFEITGNNTAYVNIKPWTFNNAGIVRKTAGAGNCVITPTAFNNSGQVEVQVGTLQVGGAGSSSPGSFAAASGTVLTWSSGGITSGATFTGAGEIRMSGGTLDGSVSSTNLIIIGPVGGTSTVSGTAILRGGTIDGSMTMTGAMDWQSGWVHGMLSIASGGSLAISGINANHELAEGGTINNSGTTTWSNGLIFRTGADASSTSCSINNLAGGVFEITGNNTAYVNVKPWSFNNAGTVRKTAGAGTSQILPTAFNSSGQVEAHVGTLQVGGAGSSSSGSFVAASGAVLNWSSGGITNDASFAGTGENRMSGGTLDGSVSSTNLVLTGPVAGTSTVSGSAILRGGTIDGNMTMTGSLDWQSGWVHGTLSIASGGALTISGNNASHELAEGGTINNSGTTTWSNGFILRTGSDTSGAACAFNNLAGALFVITGNNLAYVNVKPWTFNNAGIVRKTAGTSTSQILPTAFNSSGVVEVQVGTLQVGGAGSLSPGAFIAASGAALDWSSGGITNGASFTGSGENRMSGGTLDGSVSSTNLVLTGPVAGTSTVSGAAVLRGGTIDGNMTMTGSLDWQSGWVHGTLSIASGGALTISGNNASHELAEGGTINNSGTTTWSNGFILRTGSDTSGAACAFNNLADALFVITGNNLAYVNVKPWTFNNAGTVRKTAGTSTSQILPTAFNSTGLVEVQTGTLQLGGAGSISSGAFIAANGAALNWSSGGITNGASFTGAGENRMSGGTLDGAVSSANLVINGPVAGNSTVSGVAVLRDGTVDGTLEMTGAFDWQSGWVHGTLSIASGGVLTISGNNTNHELAEGGTVNNSGTTTWSNGFILRTGSDASLAACAFNNLPGALFVITGNNLAYVNVKPWSFNNAGTVRKVSTGRSTINTTAFTNTASTGLVEVVAGTIQFGNFNQTAGTVWLEGGNIECTNLQIQGGALKGTQSLVGNVTQTGGQIQPGSGIGTLTITGNLAQSGTGVLFAEIGGKTAGTQCDQLIVNGTAALGGGVSGTFVNGYVPRLADEFTVLRYASRTGASNWTPFVAQVGRKMIPSSAATETRLITGLETMNFTNWAEATGLTGLDAQLGADPDHDGMSNRLEYGLYLFPWVSDNKNGPAPAVTGTPQRIQITYNRINDTNDLDIEVESSTDMMNWQTIARSHHGAATADVSGGSFSITETPFPNYTKVTVVDQSAISPSQARRYLRVRVTDS